MALITKYYLVEQIRALLAGGSPSAGAKFEPRMISSYLQQAINKRLKAEYISFTLPGEETIPDGLILASYDAIPVEKYKGLSRAKLPAQPISLRRNMGVYFVGPSVSNMNLNTPSIYAVATSGSTVDISWGLVENASVYLLERASNDLFTDSVVLYNNTGLTYTDTGLEEDTTYYYRVLAQADGYENSNYDETGVTTPVETRVWDNTFDLTFGN